MERPYNYGGAPRYAGADRCRECAGSGTISYSAGDDIDYLTCAACGGKGRMARPRPATTALLRPAGMELATPRQRRAQG